MKTLPHSQTAEEQVIACLITDPRLVESLDGLQSHDFYLPSLGGIFGEIAKAYAGGKSPAEIIANDKSGKLLELTNKLPETWFFDRHVKAIKQTAQLRRAVETLQISAERIKENTDKPYEQLSEEIISNVIGSLDIGGSKSTCVHVSEAMQESYERVLALHSGENDGYSLDTPLLDLNKKLSGLWPGDSIVLAARPSMGKSALALSISLHVATKTKRPVVLFSLEMSKQLEANRILAFETEIDSNRIRNGNVAATALELLESAVKKYRDIPLYIDDKSSISSEHIRSTVSRIKREVGDLALVVIDYLQLMRWRDEKNREREIASISQAMKAIAKDYNIPVISLSQLNRMVESRTNKRPQLSDLRESGAIEQDADVVIFLYRDDYYNSDSKCKGTIELIVAKNRSGPTGTAKVLFDRELNRFRNYEENGYGQGNYYETREDYE